jgi:outer membrane protein assembly factor BamB
MIRCLEGAALNIDTAPLDAQAVTPQALPPAKKAVRIPRGLLLFLALLLLAAGCAPRTAAGSWAGLGADESGIVLVYVDRVAQVNNAGVARWEFPQASDRNAQEQFYSPPVITEDVVYFGGFNSKIYAVDRSNGQAIWVNETWTEETEASGQIIGGLTLANGMIYVGTGNGGVLALSQRSGELEWAFAEMEKGVWARPVYVNGVLYVASLDKNLYALDAGTGEELWRQDLAGAVAGAPVYVDGMLYIGSFAHKIYKLDADDGTILAEFETANWVWGSPAVANGIVYAGDLDGFVYALDADDLSPLWQRQVAQEAIRAAPLVVEDTLFIGSRDDRLYAVNAQNGTPVWNQMVGGDVLSDLLWLEDESLIVVSTLAERQLVAYNLDGQESWHYPPVASE